MDMPGMDVPQASLGIVPSTVLRSCCWLNPCCSVFSSASLKVAVLCLWLPSQVASPTKVLTDEQTLVLE